MKTQQIEKSLKVCRTVAGILKEQFPNDIMKLKENTIIEHSKKNSRLIHATSKRNGMGGHSAYYTSATPHRIIIKQKILIDQVGWDGTNYYSLNPIMEQYNPLHKKYYELRRDENDNFRMSYGPTIYGNWALIELMCHELAHHRTSGHGKGFKVKYLRLRQHMANAVISGKFYEVLKK